MSKSQRLILFVANIPLYFLIAKYLWKDFNDFLMSLRYYFQPDMYSTIMGDLLEDQKQERKLGMFFLICLALNWFEACLINRLFI